MRATRTGNRAVLTDLFDLDDDLHSSEGVATRVPAAGRLRHRSTLASSVACLDASAARVERVLLRRQAGSGRYQWSEVVGVSAWNDGTKKITQTCGSYGC
jgi:hypothetical protein